jgi:hypothetical protein
MPGQKNVNFVECPDCGDIIEEGLDCWADSLDCVTCQEEEGNNPDPDGFFTDPSL